MWPKYLDLTDEQCHAILRRLELDAYSSVVSVFRAQGKLTKERRKTLQDLSSLLNVPIERHKAEVRRSINDELLNTVAASVCGPNSENEWAREGRRIIPLLKRASVITSLTEVANKAKLDVQSNNKILLPPLRTKTFSKYKNQDEVNGESFRNNASIKKEVNNRNLYSPPPSLEDIMVKTHGNDGSQRVCVRPPSISVPVPPPSYKAYKGYFGGDIITLPSGTIIRVKEETDAHEYKNSVDNTGSNSKENLGKTPSRKLEESKRGTLGHGRKRKLSQKRKSMDEKESKISSFEVLKPTNARNPNICQMPGMQWPSSQQNYPALVQQLYHQIYQMQQQMQAQPHHRHSNAMPPPPPPLGQMSSDQYHQSTGQYLSFHQLQLGKGKEGQAMLVSGQGNPHLKGSGVIQGVVKAKRTPGAGRGRKAKNVDGRSTKKQSAYPIPGENPALPTTANYSLVTGDPTPILLEDTKRNNAPGSSNLNTDSDTVQLIESTTDSVIRKQIETTDVPTVYNMEQRKNDASSRTNLDTSEKSPLYSKSTLQSGDLNDANKKSKGDKSITCSQQTSKQQPHIIRHHATSHTQNVQLISSAATQRPKSNLTQACITTTIRPTQNVSVISASMASPKSGMSMNLATNTAKEWNTQALIHTASYSDNVGEDTENNLAQMQSGAVTTKVIVGGSTATPIKLKDVTAPTSSASSTSVSSSVASNSQYINAITTSIGASHIIGSSGGKHINPAVITNLTGMKVIPAVSGTRILPKLSTFSSAISSGATLQTAGSIGTPIYMVATPGPGGQNVMRVARTLPPGSVGATATVIGGSPTTQRVVTLNASNLKTASSWSHGVAIPSLSSVPITPGSNALPLFSGSTIRTIQPRSIVQTSGIGSSGANSTIKAGNVSSKPSVIVVQRGLPHHIISSPKATAVNKDVISGQRIVQTKATASVSGIGGSNTSNFIGKPIVIVTKAPATSITSVSASLSNNFGGSEKSANSQGNVIVLDLSQDQLSAVSNTCTSTTGNNSILSDIIQATGIMPNSDTEMVDDNNTSKTMTDGPMQEDGTGSVEVQNYTYNSHRVISSSNSESSNLAANESLGKDFDDVNDAITNENSSSRQHLENSRNKQLEISSDENGDSSETWAPVIIDTTTITKRIKDKRIYRDNDGFEDKSNKDTNKRNRALTAHSKSEVQEDLCTEDTSKINPKVVITNTLGLHKNSSRHKPYDIVSAAFEDAELGQFEQCDVEMEGDVNDGHSGTSASIVTKQNNSVPNRPKLYNMTNNQDGNDNNEVLGTDILNAAVALADHQENYDGKFRSLESTSVSYLSEDSSSLDNAMGQSSYKFFSKKQNNLESSTPSSMKESSKRMPDKKKGAQYIQEYGHSSQGMIHQFKRNSDIGDEFSDLHAATDNGSHGEGENQSSRGIRSVTLTPTDARLMQMSSSSGTEK